MCPMRGRNLISHVLLVAIEDFVLRLIHAFCGCSSHVDCKLVKRHKLREAPTRSIFDLLLFEERHIGFPRETPCERF
jgi:hypothetical protein